MERKKFTDFDRKFARLIAPGYKWIARDKDEMLMVFTDKPTRDKDTGDWAFKPEDEGLDWEYLYGLDTESVLKNISSDDEDDYVPAYCEACGAKMEGEKDE